VASANDPYVTLDRAQAFADGWGADFCFAGELGHINTDSQLGFWPRGLLMRGQLLTRVNR